jgi:hypothetical protein
MEEKQITHQKLQEVITLEKVDVDGKKPLEYDEISISKTWIDSTWMSLTREGQVFLELRSPHDDDKCRRHSSQSSWIASEDNTRGYKVMFETSLLRIDYLNNF